MFKHQLLRILLGLFAFSIVLVRANFALAFGATGHEAICEIAYDELTPPARHWVDIIMASETDSHFKTFPEACAWPDQRAPIQNARREEHFINVPRDFATIPNAQCQGATTCLFTAIPADIAVLEDASAPTEKRLQSLKFLGHWLGDIHQPLHISFADDRGGNDILVDGVTGCARGKDTVLHAVWDTCIPEQIMHDMNVQVTHPFGAGRAKFGDALDADITDAERAQWKASNDPLVWANESYEDARASDVGYCFQSGDICRYSTDSDAFKTGSAMRVFQPDGNYKEDHAALVKTRLQAAGVRLAAILQRIADAQQ